MIVQNLQESKARQDSPFVNIQKYKTNREAADAGLLLWRKNFSVFILFFALPFWITAFLLRIALPGNYQYFSWLIIWFLKPLFDRIILHIISIRFFDKDADVKRLSLGLGKSILRGLAGDLLWRRFSPLRAAIMPVRVLERNLKTGKSAALRRQLLKKGGIDFCLVLTLWAVSVEIALLFGETVFFITFAELFMQGLAAFFNDFLEIEIIYYAAWCLNIILVETIYVCMGFCLYINSRIEVEGWDIEIKFREFAKEKQHNKLSGNAKPAILAAFFICVFLFMPEKSYAQNNLPAVPLDQLHEILDSPEFGRTEDSWGIRFKSRSQESDLPDINSELTERIQKISARVLQLLLIGIIAAAMVFLFFYLRNNKLIRSGMKKQSKETMLYDKYAEDPKQLLEKALAFYEKGDTRLGWGYCTAAAIKSWAYHGITFAPNATESDCAAAVNSMNNNNPNAQKFDRLIKNWVYLVYAGRLPAEGSFEDAVAFVKAQYG